MQDEKNRRERVQRLAQGVADKSGGGMLSVLWVVINTSVELFLKGS